jgi:hypothetical protein
MLAIGCDDSPSNSVPAYRPETFRDEIGALIQQERYDDAVRYVSAADPVKQAQHDGEGYLAVAEEAIFLPGVESEVFFDRDRDWEFPGTSDVVRDEEWQQAATEFAEQYNQARLSESQ